MDAGFAVTHMGRDRAAIRRSRYAQNTYVANPEYCVIYSS